MSERGAAALQRRCRGSHRRGAPARFASLSSAGRDSTLACSTQFSRPMRPGRPSKPSKRVDVGRSPCGDLANRVTPLACRMRSASALMPRMRCSRPRRVTAGAEAGAGAGAGACGVCGSRSAKRRRSPPRLRPQPLTSDAARRDTEGRTAGSSVAGWAADGCGAESRCCGSAGDGALGSWSRRADVPAVVMP